MAPTLLTCLLVCLPLVRCNIFTNIASGIAGGVVKTGELVERGVIDSKGAVEGVAVAGLSSQCQLVKNILQLSYDDYTDDEPDFSKLALVYISENGTTTNYNLSSAAADLMEVFDDSQNLFIYLHGFTDDPSGTSYGTVRNSMYDAGFTNVLGLDASSLIRWLYLRSSTMVHYIGEQLGKTLADMFALGLKSEQIHLIGHSLGAQISGFTGKQFLELTGEKIGRISGLDPAGPCFTAVNGSYRLEPTDAVFVDVIHTDAGVFGIDADCGQVDYYPNEGSNQLGCFFQTCSHSRAWEYFAESIVNATAFKAVQCEDWHEFKKGECSNVTSYMGFSATPESEGQFYLITARDTPYGLGEDGTKYTVIV